MYANLLGGDDLAVTQRRVVLTLPPEGCSDEEEAPVTARECEVCPNEAAEGDTLCPGCRNNVHRN